MLMAEINFAFLLKNLKFLDEFHLHRRVWTARGFWQRRQRWPWMTKNAASWHAPRIRMRFLSERRKLRRTLELQISQLISNTVDKQEKEIHSFSNTKRLRGHSRCPNCATRARNEYPPETILVSAHQTSWLGLYHLSLNNIWRYL
jgi:hypothetical protein